MIDSMHILRYSAIKLQVPTHTNIAEYSHDFMSSMYILSGRGTEARPVYSHALLTVRARADASTAAPPSCPVRGSAGSAPPPSWWWRPRWWPSPPSGRSLPTSRTGVKLDCGREFSGEFIESRRWHASVYIYRDIITMKLLRCNQGC